MTNLEILQRIMTSKDGKKELSRILASISIEYLRCKYCKEKCSGVKNNCPEDTVVLEQWLDSENS